MNPKSIISYSSESQVEGAHRSGENLDKNVISTLIPDRQIL